MRSGSRIIFSGKLQLEQEGVVPHGWRAIRFNPFPFFLLLYDVILYEKVYPVWNFRKGIILCCNFDCEVRVIFEGAIPIFESD